MPNGYKAGGFNLSSYGRPYNSETITAYEAGIKSDLFGRTARINVDAFYYNYTDLTATYRLDDVGLRFTTYVTNPENKVERNNIYLTPGFIGVSPTTAYTKPRTVGVRIDYAF